MRHILIIFYFFTLSTIVQAQQVLKIKFDKLDSLLHTDNDTTYVINFWATWCKPCVEELPVFEKLNTASLGKKTKVILITLDMSKEYNSALIPFLKKNHIQSCVWMLDAVHANDWIDKVSDAWSGAIPATLIYASKRKRFFEKSFTYPELIDTMKQP